MSWSNSKIEELLGTMKFIGAGVLWDHEHLGWLAVALLVLGALDIAMSILTAVREIKHEQRHDDADKADDRKVDRS